MEMHTGLEDGMYLDGKIVYFERKKLLDTFSLMLPDS